jgi:hypothetical protein
VITAHQLYPASRTAGMSTRQLRSVRAFAQADTATPWSAYDGMTHDETRAAAARTVADVTAELRRRIAE